MSAEKEDYQIAFREARIPPLYYREKLTEMDFASHVLAYVQDEMIDAVEQGEGALVLSDDYERGDRVLHALAKSLVARNFEVMTLTVTDLLAELDDTDTNLWHMEVIVLADFDNPAFVENPLPPFRRFMVEEAVTRLLKLERPVFAYMTEDSPWWSDRLRTLLGRRTRRFVV